MKNADTCVFHNPAYTERRLRAVEKGRAVQAEKRHAPTDFDAHLAACDKQDRQDALRNDRALLYWILWNRAGRPTNAISHVAMTLFHFWVGQQFPARLNLYAEHPEWLRWHAMIYDLTQEIETAVRAVVEPQGVTDKQVWKEFTKLPMPELSPLPAESQMIPRPPSPLTGPVVQLEMRG